MGRKIDLFRFWAEKSICFPAKHVTLWALHSGMRECLENLCLIANPDSVVEYDVEDCFLNTPRDKVLVALRYWMELLQSQRRRAVTFAISKDCNRNDKLGPSYSLHFWELSADVVEAIVQWDMDCNGSFAVQGRGGDTVMLNQSRGLPIGGCLSAGLVELVALFMEHVKPWPLLLLQMDTASYRDNFFMVPTAAILNDAQLMLATELSAFYEMPVKLEGAGFVRLCLEMRLHCQAGSGIKATLAYRNDADRQGESHDVSSWPPWCDPRARSVLHSLLCGLAAKIAAYHVDGLHGLPASVRAAVQFLRGRGYPTKKWLRPFALALLHRGVPRKSLPRSLLGVL